MIVLCLAAGALLWPVSAVVANEGSLPPPAENGPVSVSIGYYLLNTGNINEADNTFDVELDVIVTWQDKRLAFDPAVAGTDRQVFLGPAAEAFRNRIWNAQINVDNIVGMIEISSQKVTLFSDGRVQIEAHANVTVRADLDYRRFPFDQQVLPIRLRSFAWNRDEVVLTLNPDQTGFDPDFLLAEWNIISVDAKSDEVLLPRATKPFSRLTLNIAIDRKVGFYVWKVFLSLFIIVAISWTVFWMHREQLGRRVGVSVTGILTVIAYQFIVAGFIPRVSYLTALDKITLFSVVLIALTLVVSVVVDQVKARSEAAAYRIDATCRWAFPLFYFAVVALVVLQSLS